MPRSRYGVALLAIVGLAVFSLAVLLYLQGRKPGLGGPGFSMVPPCKWDPALFRDPGENTCERRCESRYDGGVVQAFEPGQDHNWLFCCPTGYTACPAPDGGRVCKTGASC